MLAGLVRAVVTPADRLTAAPADERPPGRRRTGRRVLAATSLAALAALALAALAASSGAIITTFAGNGTAAATGDNGPAASASLNLPDSVAVTPAGVAYVADTVNNKIRRVTAGTITTAAGTGTAGHSGDGAAATAATLRGPSDVAVDGAGAVYVADTDNHVVRKISAGGTISTVAGTPGVAGYLGDGGAATAARLAGPTAVAVEADGDLLIGDSDNRVVRRVTPGGTISTVAGNNADGSGGDGGPATSASLRMPTDLAVLPDGGYLIADPTGNRIRKVSAAGTITTFAGTGTYGFSGDGGLATAATLGAPVGVAAGGGDVFIADTYNSRVRRVSPTGKITTVAGTTAGFGGDGGDATAAQLNLAKRVAVGPDGLYIADTNNHRVRRVLGLGAGPEPPTVSAVTPAGPANDNAPRVTGTAAADSTVRLYTDADCTSAIAGSGTAAAFASPGIAATVPGDATTVLYAAAVDADGDSSACSPTSVSYTEDSTPPGAASIGSAPTTRSADTTPTWTFTGPATLQCRLDGPDGAVEGWADCASPKTPAALTPDGVYTLSVRTRDSAGNTSTPATNTYTLDTTGPAAPAFGTTPDGDTNDPTPTFTFTGEADATFRCRMWREGVALGLATTCSSGHTPDLSGQADGAFTLRVHAVDALGNAGADAEVAFTLDRAAPAPASFDGTPATIGNDAGPQWPITVPSGATAECRLDLGEDEVADWAACSSPVTYALAADGAYTVGLRSRDAAGNRGAAVQHAYELDRVEPGQPALTSEPPSAGAGVSPAWAFSSETGATFECKVVRGTDLVADWTSCGSPRTVSLAGEVDGTYTFSVRATDTAQNTGDPRTDTYTLDRTAPAISASPAATGRNERPSWSFAAVGAAGYQCRLALDGEPVPAWATCTSPTEYDLTERPDGGYTFAVRALDPQGDPSAAVTDAYALDSTPPPAPAVGEQTAGIGSGAAASWAWTGEAGSDFECRLERNGAPTEAWAPCTSPRTADLTGAPDGTYRLGIRALDDVGNISTIASDEYVLDRLPPTPPSYSAAPAPAGNGPSPAWTFASDPGVLYECRLERDGGLVEDFVACASPRTYELAGRPDGTYVMLVRARDGAGNVAVTRSAPYGLDRAAPGATQVTAAPGATGNDRTPTWQFGAAGATAFECGLFRGGDVLSELSGCSGSWTFDLSGRPDGAYTFRVRGLDDVRNAGALVDDEYVLDTEAPEEPEIRGDESQQGGDESPTWRFTAEPGAIVECGLRRGDTVVSRMAACATPRSYDLAKADDGTYTFTVRATDAAGNVGRGATATYRLDRPAPTDEEPASAAAPAPPAAAPPAPDPVPAAAPSAGAPAAPETEATPAAKRRAAERREARREAAAAAATGRRDAAPDSGTAASPAASAPEREKKGLAGAAQKLGEVGKVVAEAAAVAAEKSAFPGLLLAFCGLFLVVQDRIDRRDPKLALAPIDADPELEFLPLDDLAADDSWKAPACPA